MSDSEKKTETEIVPVKVYLDQGDWSNLQDGVAGAAECRLRQLGREQKAVFLVSAAHFIETGKLKSGFKSRVAYLHGFPGTVWMKEVAGKKILKLSVQRLLDEAEGRLPDPMHFEADPLGREDFQKTANFIKLASWGLRLPLLMMTTAERMGRKARYAKLSKKKDLEAQNRYTATVLFGDTAAWRDQLSKRGMTLGPISNLFLETIHPVMTRMGAWFQRRGVVPLDGKRLDPIFASCVVPHLSREVALAPDRMDSLMRIWKDQQARARVAPSLACVASVDEYIHYLSDYEFKESDIWDMMHVAFAPLVDIFTCDKRNVRPVERTLKLGGISTQVFRTRRLDEVADAVEDAVAQVANT